MRLHAQTAQFENGFVILPKSAPWLDDYVNELISFPMGKYDDQVDSTAQALAWLLEAAREPGIIAYYRMLCEKQGLT
jgi:predicted phage terminase large subunit-like protein